MAHVGDESAFGRVGGLRQVPRLAHLGLGQSHLRLQQAGAGCVGQLARQRGEGKLDVTRQDAGMAAPEKDQNAKVGQAEGMHGTTLLKRDQG